MTKTVFKELSAKIIVNSNVFRGLEDAEFNEINRQIYVSGKEVKFVTDMLPYTSMKAIKEMIVNGKVEQEHLEYFANREMTAEEIAVVVRFVESKKALDELLFANQSYQLADVPATWNIDRMVTFNKTGLRYNGYSIGNKTFEKLWMACLNYWMNQGSNRLTLTIDGGSRDIRIENTEVRIGCQTINRYALEQVALKMGLSFTT